MGLGQNDEAARLQKSRACDHEKKSEKKRRRLASLGKIKKKNGRRLRWSLTKNGPKERRQRNKKGINGRG